LTAFPKHDIAPRLARRSLCRRAALQ